MRFEAVRGKAPFAIVAVLLAATACAPICGSRANQTTIASATSSPAASPTATSTTPLQASSAPFHSGEVGLAYGAVNLTATGGVSPYTWSVSSGQLPGGLALAGGSVSGTPTAAGNFSFTIQVTDAHGGTATLPGVIAIAPALTASLIPACAQYCRVELGCVDVCGPFGQMSGGVGPFSYSLAQGQLPAGTTLSGLALTGKFVGLSGYLKFTVQVADALGATTTIAPTFWMYDHISLAGGPIPANPNTTCWWTGYDPVNAPGCQAQFAFSGGTPNAGTPTVSAAWASYTCNYQPACASPPPMPSIAVGSGLITVTVPRGYSSGTSGYMGTLTITLTNQDGCSPGPIKCSASANVTITQASG